jgi:alanine-synthesizing transaminase
LPRACGTIGFFYLLMKDFPLKAEFPRIQRLPPYVFAVVTELKMQARARGEDIIDFGMGNPDQPTPKHIVDKLVEVAQRDDTHRYSASKGIPRLRRAITQWYKQRFNVELNPDTEAIVTIGSKEGLAHLALATMGPGDSVLVPNPAYPIHPYGFVISGADVHHVPLIDGVDFFEELVKAIKNSWPKPKMLVLNFPGNPTAQCVELDFFEKVVEIATEYGIWVIHDLAYADIVFDGYVAPSILQVKGAKDIAVESFSMSKSYNMPGWRVGFMCGNPTLIGALGKLKSYLDYGTFTPIQVAAITALEESQDCVREIREMYHERRNVLCDGLNAIGWQVERPKGSMFVWAKIPEQYLEMGSLEFCKKLIKDAKVAVSPGIGFGQYGDDHVRIALIENPHRTRQAIRGIKDMFKKDGGGG